MEDNKSALCQICASEIHEGEASIVCPSCGRVHHDTCWKKHRGCAVCDQSAVEGEGDPLQPNDRCMKCGIPLEEGIFCPACGTPRSVTQENACIECGAVMYEGQEFCAECGHRARQALDASSSTADSSCCSNEKKEKNRMKKRCACVGAVVICALVSAWFFMSPEEAKHETINFNTMVPSISKDDASISNKGYTAFVTATEKSDYERKVKLIGRKLGFTDAQLHDIANLNESGEGYQVTHSKGMTSCKNLIIGEKAFADCSCLESRLANVYWVRFVIRDEYRDND